MSNKKALIIIGACVLIVMGVFTFIKVDSSKHLSEEQITKSLKKNIDTTLTWVKTNEGVYSCDVWEGNYEKFMLGLRNSLSELSKKKNTQYKLIVVNLKDAKLPKGNELVNSFAIYIEDLYNVNWLGITSYEEFKKICNIE